LFAVLVGQYWGNVRLYQSILLAAQMLQLCVVVEGLRKARALFRICFCFGQGSVLLLWPRLAEEAALVLQDGLSVTMEMLLSSKSFLLLLLLICSKKGVLKVNCAEERGGTKFS
jgi:hypothetical protein